MTRPRVDAPRLIKALKHVFGDKEFDATDVVCKAKYHDAELLAAIDVEIPRARYQSGWRSGDLNADAIRVTLKRLDRNGLIARYHAANRWWSFLLERKE